MSAAPARSATPSPPAPCGGLRAGAGRRRGAAARAPAPCGSRRDRDAGGRRPAPGEGLGLRRARPAAAALRHRARPCAGWRPRSRRWRPRRWSLLGDSFHDRGGEARLAADDADAPGRPGRGPRPWSGSSATTTPTGPRGLPGEAAAEPGARRPASCATSRSRRASRARSPATCIPAPGSTARGGSVRRRCFVTDGERLILPAFGASPAA